jgi:predicted polyphosphate/ATP-dependent NAD kinase
VSVYDVRVLTDAAVTGRWGHIASRNLRQPQTRRRYQFGSAEDVQSTLRDAGIPFDPWPTGRAGHATDLARKAVVEGRELVIAPGGDGTVNEVARGLANMQTVLGLMPLGSS